MTHKQDSKIRMNGIQSAILPNPEVTPKAKRRNFTAGYKRWVLEEADKCRQQRGQIGELLRREGLYSSHLVTWQRQREAGELAGLTPGKRGRKTDRDGNELRQLRDEKRRLERRLEQAELIIEAQKKLSEILGVTLESENGGSG
jgi:transposase-like protein